MEPYKNQAVIYRFISWGHAMVILWCLYPFFFCFFRLEESGIVIFCMTGILLLLPIIISWYAVRRLKNLFLYIGAGLAVSIIYAALNGIVYAFLGLNEYWGAAFSLTLSFLLFLSRGYWRIQRAKEDYVKEAGAFFLDAPSPAHWIYLAFHYILGSLYKVPFYWHMAFWLFMSDLFLCFAFRFARGFHNFLQNHSHSANMPVKTMQKITRIIFCMGCIVLSAFALPSILYGKAPLGNLSFDKKSVVGKVTAGDSQMETFPDVPANLSIQEELASITHKPSRWLVILSNIIVYLFGIGGIFAALMLFYHFCRKAGDYFSSATEDEISFLEKKVHVHPAEKKLRQWQARHSVNMSIRKYYKKTLSKGLKGIPAGSETPSELEEDAGITGNANHLLLHNCYEKARYSKEGCTQEDADVLKNNYRDSDN